MQLDLNKIVRYVIGIALVLLFVWLLGYCSNRQDKTPAVEVRYDTITILQHDTVHITRCIKQERYHYDTLLLHDTVYIRDTPQLYSDSTPRYKLDIRAVKLYDYALDIYQTDTLTQYVPQTADNTTSSTNRKGRFGQSVVVGLQVGYGIGVQPSTMQAAFQPYIGIGITYGFGYSW